MSNEESGLMQAWYKSNLALGSIIGWCNGDAGTLELGVVTSRAINGRTIGVD